MPAIDLRSIVAAATRKNAREYVPSKGSRSLDEDAYENGKVKLGDRLIDEAATYEDDDRPIEYHERLSGLFALEQYAVMLDDLTIASGATRRRRRAELGEGWPSSLSLQATL